MNLFDPEFYPTPAEVIKKMIEPYGPRLDSATILEPSAGNGAIVDFLCNTGIEVQFETSKGQTYIHTMRAKAENVYCIEKNPDLRMILQQKKYRVLDSDFLSFAPEHRFNLLTMNPPFSDGDRHLLHAWDILIGGDIVCLLNAETIRNTFSASRKRLATIIEQNGSVEYIGKAFHKADNPTDVEVAIVRLHKEAADDPFRIDPGAFATEKTPDFAEMAASGDALAQSSRIDAYLRCWDLTKAAAADLIKSYGRFVFFASAFMQDHDNSPGRATNHAEIIGESILDNLKGMRYGTEDMASVYNRFVDHAKANAWGIIFNEIGLGKYMTTGLQKKLDEFRTAQGAASITKENIFSLFRFIMTNISSIMDQSVVEVYDMLTRYYKGNTSHDEGWKTNKRFKCNRKVILPDAVSAGFKPQVYGYDRYFSLSSYAHYGVGRLEDIDKAMCWLTGKDYNSLINGTLYGNDFRARSGPNHSLSAAVTSIPVGSQDWHDSAFFRIKAFKKGTIHLEFKDEALWAKFNLAVNQGKNLIGAEE